MQKNVKIGFIIMLITFLLCAFLSIEHEAGQNVIITPTSRSTPTEKWPDESNDDNGSTLHLHGTNSGEDDVDHSSVPDNDLNRYSGKFIHRQWRCHFHLFITSKLHHSISNGFIEKCESVDPQDIGSLVVMTSSYLQQEPISIDKNDRNSYHDLLSLRRIVMLLHRHSVEVIPGNDYDDLLNQIAMKEQTYFIEHRTQFPVFNIHPPRSAGTTMCGWFRGAKNNQKRLSDEEKATQTIIHMNPEPQRNCNIMPDGKQFTHYDNIDGKTCAEQYADAKANGFTMIARESPLYNNANRESAHPTLCDGFVYTFPFRSPIERILSWMKADHRWAAKGFEEIEGSMDQMIGTKAIGKFLPYFFYSLFAADHDENDIKIKEGDRGWDQHKIVRIASRQQWLRGYASNGVVRWIGYQWTHSDINGNKQLLEGLTAEVEKVNGDDIHFMNAVDLLLKIDYVLPFASYADDISAVEATKYGEVPLENIHLNASFPMIVERDPKGIWNVMARNMNRHYKIPQDLEIFGFGHKSPRTGQTSSFVDSIQEEDWQTLYRVNQFEFRLYSLAKYIAQVDSEFHSQIFDKVIGDFVPS